MKSKIKNVLAGGMVAVAVAVPSHLYKSNKEYQGQLQEQQESFQAQLQQAEAETEALLKQLEGKETEIISLTNSNKELESKNTALEYVRSTIINNVGYFPSDKERALLEKLVECEAGAESMAGKIAVVNVVLNRVQSSDYPNSIYNVIYQKNQFEPIVTGVIYRKEASSDSKEAVKRAFMGEKAVGSDILSFWAKWLNKNNDIWKNCTIETTIGVHHFSRGWRK